MNRRTGDDVAKLGDEMSKVGAANVAKAAARSLAADMWFRGVMVAVVCGIFVWLNSSVMNFVRDAFVHDGVRLAAAPPMAAADRLVNANVIMAMIGATVVQTGIGFIAIITYLFPKRPG